ncbi:MAG TPA: hypothetical protein DD473_09050 [Planctomycetaceae bacterium]|nr:hypothetical protein [Planctomycetaceae bacterium]|tara:strand:+ start:278 stop:955 length:678 start_codon:yes stop_codon:yes gene_type:complete
MNQRIRNILEDLEAVRENLLALSDDIWLSIDHNDSEALDRGYQFKKTYNDKAASFDVLASDISEIVQQFTEVRLESSEESGIEDEVANQRIIQELKRDEPHCIDEDFTFIRPYGFILDGKGTIGITNWRLLYISFCRQLAKRDSERFQSLPENSDHISNRGHRAFNRNPDELRTSSEITDGIHAEVNLSANMIRNEIRRLLKSFQIPETRFQVYLREDRDANRSR